MVKTAYPVALVRWRFQVNENVITVRNVLITKTFSFSSFWLGPRENHYKHLYIIAVMRA